jgi:hypothetical protein
MKYKTFLMKPILITFLLFYENSCNTDACHNFENNGEN